MSRLHSLITSCVFGLTVALLSSEPLRGEDPSQETVGRRERGELVTPVNQRITPIGSQLDLPGLRPQGLALSPNGKLLAVSGKTSELIVIDPEKGTIKQRVKLPANSIHGMESDVPPSKLVDDKGQLSYTGLIFSPSGDRVYLSDVNGSIKVFVVHENGEVAPLHAMPLPLSKNEKRAIDIPAGLAISPDGQKLYVALNLSNRLAEIDVSTGKAVRIWDVGMVPYGVVLAGSKVYVTNWGGRRPDADSTKGPAGKGTEVRVDPVRHIANDGSVTVIDLDQNKVINEIVVELHPSGIVLSPDGKHVVVTNAASDTLSVIDAASDKVVEKIWTKQNPAVLFGASPNALAFSNDGKTIFVCNGTMNSVAVIEFNPGESELEGLLPVGWFPGAIAVDPARGSVYVSNIKGLSVGRPNEKTGMTEFNSHQHYGSVTFISDPGEIDLKKATQTVMRNCREPAVVKSLQPPRPDATPRALPARTGEPSLVKHVVYIIKENRTYDQVFGDLPQGNGEPTLCVFGEKVTPNQHKMVKEFVLLDNTYCSGLLSADGHNWATTSIATDYLEKSFAGFPRSYPDGMSDEEIDAIAYSPAGFLWDNALAHKQSLRIYGEFAITEAKWRDKKNLSTPKFIDYYRDFQNQTNLLDISSRPAIASIKDHLCTNTVGWDMDIPDVFRAAQFIKELKEFEKQGTFPNLVIICLPNDHTSGTAPGAPTPAAQVADNDLAFGQIVEAISHSPFWKETCIFAIEDDPQAGWDHVSGYRTTAYVIGPYVRRGTVIHSQYNQTSLIRSMELMLGLPPMNIMDASASPMFDCFTDTPDLTPYDAVKNNIPLDEMNPQPQAITDPLLRKYAEESSRLPLDKIDQCDEDLLNRIIWHAQMGSEVIYPEWAVVRDEDD